MEMEYSPAVTDTFPTYPKSYLEEHYVTHIVKNVDNTPGNDIVIAAHPNGITFITLAPSHAVFNTPTPNSSTLTSPTIVENQDLEACLKFDVGYQQSEDQGGKCKSLIDAPMCKGRGPFISPDQPLCKLQFTSTSTSSTSGTSEYLIICPLIKGLLVEINQKIVKLRGDALLQKLKDEYIAIIDLRPSEVEKLREAAGNNGVGDN